MYLKTNIGLFRPARPVINDGTWKSLVYNFTQSDDAAKSTGTSFQPELKSKPLIHKSQVANSWAVPFFGPDRLVILNTQKFFYEHHKKRPIQYFPYLAVGPLINVIAVSFLAAIFVLFAQFKCGRTLLLKYPRIFTCGCMAPGGPSEETQDNTCFAFVLHGQGWKDQKRAGDAINNHSAPTDSTIVAQVKGVNGYKVTGVALALSAITVITETIALPGRGGVFTPGAAFAKTSLLRQLRENGLSFEIVSKSSF